MSAAPSASRQNLMAEPDSTALTGATRLRNAALAGSKCERLEPRAVAAWWRGGGGAAAGRRDARRTRAAGPGPGAWAVTPDRGPAGGPPAFFCGFAPPTPRPPPPKKQEEDKSHNFRYHV